MMAPISAKEKMKKYRVIKVLETTDSHRDCSKIIYDHIFELNSLSSFKSKALKKLLIDGFDNEQIFQQMELRNQSDFEHLNKGVASINVESEADCSATSVYSPSILPSNDTLYSKEFDYDDDSDSSEDATGLLKKEAIPSNVVDYPVDSDKQDSELSEEESNFTIAKKFKQDTKRKFHSAVDDQFFKLSDLEEFLRLEDVKAGNESEVFDCDKEEMDYYQDTGSDESESDRNSQKNCLMYEDFFDPPESGDENVSIEEESSAHDLNETANDEDEEDSNLFNNNRQENDPESSLLLKTPFEVEQDKVKKTILEYEETLIQKAEWHLTGEAAANNRPKDSLLQKETDFDVNAKPVIIEDSTFCEKIEQAIISIIKNKSYSDGQRTVKPNNDIASFKKEDVLDQNKSKKSLAQVYEEDYLKKKYGEEEQENSKHLEINQLMNSLLPELQALFCHIPKAAIPDIKIVSNLPAITVEEVAPTSTSDVTLLAPEQIKKNSGSVKGQSERCDTDRKRERRKKKKFQKMKINKLEKEALKNPLSAKARKLDKLNTLKKVLQHRNTKLLK